MNSVLHLEQKYKRKQKRENKETSDPLTLTDALWQIVDKDTQPQGSMDHSLCTSLSSFSMRYSLDFSLSLFVHIRLSQQDPSSVCQSESRKACQEHVRVICQSKSKEKSKKYIYFE